jgi:hypothetical protein
MLIRCALLAADEEAARRRVCVQLEQLLRHLGNCQPVVEHLVHSGAAAHLLRMTVARAAPAPSCPDADADATMGLWRDGYGTVMRAPLRPSVHA